MSLSDDDILDLVQRQTLKYFTDFAHPVSGMARERTNNMEQYGQDIVATGGTGFGIMAMVAGAERGFLTRDDARARIEKIADFLREKADKFDGMFPHFMEGTTGKAVSVMGAHDNGSDAVETSFLMMGLLTARQYFNAAAPEETRLREKINALWEGCDWNRHVKQGEDHMRWHRGPAGQWTMDLPIKGWSEALVTHILAAAAPIEERRAPACVYEAGWTGGDDFINGKEYGGISLPLGPDKGGPLFLSQYSFLGVDPRGLSDAHADYWAQNVNHTRINRAHCVENPHGFAGYGEACWGLSSSDDPRGYEAHSPTQDNGTVSPTAALCAFPYTPKESMQALRHFFEDRGHEIWGAYGFTAAFNDTQNWHAQTCLAIDQGPIVAMIENHRSGLLWNLFMSCPEVKCGLERLKFESPHLAPRAQETPSPDAKPPRPPQL